MSGASVSSFGSTRSSGDGLKPIAGDEENVFDESSNIIQLGIFGVLYTVSKEKNLTSVKFAFFRLLLDFLQLWLLVVNPSYGWAINAKNTAWEVVSFIQLNAFLAARGYTFFLGIFYLFVGLLGVNLALSVWVAYSFSNNRFEYVWPIQFLRWFGLIFYQVLDIATLTLLLVALDCSYFGVPHDVLFRNQEFPGVMCWSMPHIIHVVVSGSSIVLFVIMATAMVLSEMELNPLTRNYMAIAHTRDEGLGFLIKTVLTIASVMLPGSLKALSLVYILLLSLLFYTYVKWVPFIYSALNYVRCSSYGMVMYSSILLVVLAFGPSGTAPETVKFQERVTLALWVGMGPAALVGGAICHLRLRHIQHWVVDKFREADPGTNSKSIYKFTDAREVEIAARCCRRWVEDEDTLEPEAVALSEHIIKAGMIQLPQDPQMIILYSSFLIDVQGSYQSGYTQLQTAKKQPLGLLQSFAIFSREQEHAQKASGANSGDTAAVDLVSYVEFQRNHRLVVRAHKEALMAIRSFWGLLLRSKINFNHLSKALHKIEGTVKAAERAYRGVLVRHASSARIVRLYGKFLENVKFDPWAASKWYAEADRLEEEAEQSKEAMQLGGIEALLPQGNGGDKGLSAIEGLAIICINAQGQIVVASPEAHALLGYGKNELKGKDLGIILPHPFSERHTAYVRQYIQTGVTNLMGRHNEVMVITKTRKVLPVLLKVSKISGLNEDSVFLGMIEPLPPRATDAQLWVMGNGTILAADATLCDWLGYEQSDLSGKLFEDFLVEKDAVRESIKSWNRAHNTPGPSSRAAGARYHRRQPVATGNGGGDIMSPPSHSVSSPLPLAAGGAGIGNGSSFVEQMVPATGLAMAHGTVGSEVYSPLVLPRATWRHKYLDPLQFDTIIQPSAIGSTRVHSVVVRRIPRQQSYSPYHGQLPDPYYHEMLLAADHQGHVLHVTEALAAALGRTVEAIRAGGLAMLVPEPTGVLHGPWLQELSNPQSFGTLSNPQYKLPPYSCRSGRAISLCSYSEAQGPGVKHFQLSVLQRLTEGGGAKIHVVTLTPRTLDEAVSERRMRLSLDLRGTIIDADGATPAELFGIDPRVLVGSCVAQLIDLFGSSDDSFNQAYGDILDPAQRSAAMAGSSSGAVDGICPSSSAAASVRSGAAGGSNPIARGIGWRRACGLQRQRDSSVEGDGGLTAAVQAYQALFARRLSRALLQLAHRSADDPDCSWRVGVNLPPDEAAISELKQLAASGLLRPEELARAPQLTGARTVPAVMKLRLVRKQAQTPHPQQQPLRPASQEQQQPAPQQPTQLHHHQQHQHQQHRHQHQQPLHQQLRQPSRLQRDYDAGGSRAVGSSTEGPRFGTHLHRSSAELPGGKGPGISGNNNPVNLVPMVPQRQHRVTGGSGDGPPPAAGVATHIGLAAVAEAEETEDDDLRVRSVGFGSHCGGSSSGGGCWRQAVLGRRPVAEATEQPTTTAGGLLTAVVLQGGSVGDLSVKAVTSSATGLTSIAAEPAAAAAAVAVSELLAPPSLVFEVELWRADLLSGVLEVDDKGKVLRTDGVCPLGQAGLVLGAAPAAIVGAQVSELIPLPGGSSGVTALLDMGAANAAAAGDSNHAVRGALKKRAARVRMGGTTVKTVRHQSDGCGLELQVTAVRRQGPVGSAYLLLRPKEPTGAQPGFLRWLHEDDTSGLMPATSHLYTERDSGAAKGHTTMTSLGPVEGLPSVNASVVGAGGGGNTTMATDGGLNTLRRGTMNGQQLTALAASAASAMVVAPEGSILGFEAPSVLTGLRHPAVSLTAAAMAAAAPAVALDGLPRVHSLEGLWGSRAGTRRGSNGNNPGSGARRRMSFLRLAGGHGSGGRGAAAAALATKGGTDEEDDEDNPISVPTCSGRAFSMSVSPLLRTMHGGAPGPELLNRDTSSLLDAAFERGGGGPQESTASLVAAAGAGAEPQGSRGLLRDLSRRSRLSDARHCMVESWVLSSEGGAQTPDMAPSAAADTANPPRGISATATAAISTGRPPPLVLPRPHASADGGNLDDAENDEAQSGAAVSDEGRGSDGHGGSEGGVDDTGGKAMRTVGESSISGLDKGSNAASEVGPDGSKDKGEAEAEANFSVGKRFQKLQKILMSSLALQPARRLRWRALMAVLLVLSANIVTFALLLVKLLNQQEAVSDLNNVANACRNVHEIAINGRVLESLYSGSSYVPGLRLFGEPQQDTINDIYADLLETSQSMKVLHHGVYLGFRSLRRMPSSHGLRSIWDDPLLEFTVFYDLDDPNGPEPQFISALNNGTYAYGNTTLASSVVRMGLWDAGNYYLTKTFDLINNGRNITSQGREFASWATWKFIHKNGLDVIFPAYLQTLDALVELTVAQSKDIYMLQLLVVCLETGLLCLLSCVYMWIITQQLEANVANDEDGSDNELPLEAGDAGGQNPGGSMNETDGVLTDGAVKAAAAAARAATAEAETRVPIVAPQRRRASFLMFSRKGTSSSFAGGGDDESCADAASGDRSMRDRSLRSTSERSAAGNGDHSVRGGTAGAGGILSKMTGSGFTGLFSLALWRQRAMVFPNASMSSRSSLVLGGRQKRRLVGSHRLSYQMVAPFILWGAAMVAINLAGYFHLKKLAAPIATLDIVNTVVIRFHRVLFYSLEVAAALTAALCDALKPKLVKELAAWRQEYAAMLYGREAVPYPDDKHYRLATTGVLFGGYEEPAQLLYHTGSCLADNPADCQPPDSEFYEATHNGLDVLLKTQFTRVESLVQQPPESSGLNSSEFRFLWATSQTDMEGGLGKMTDIFLGDVLGSYREVVIQQLVMFCVAWVFAALFLVLQLRPILRYAEYEMRRVAELLSQLPPEVDCEGMVTAVVLSGQREQLLLQQQPAGGKLAKGGSSGRDSVMLSAAFGAGGGGGGGSSGPVGRSGRMSDIAVAAAFATVARRRSGANMAGSG
ncbi:hypothetical protein PLESTM_001090800 [Pleodorina starrii]|nr:hypothetical protein PLESTM_001090800 [Pleodorina starrii]